jgi:uncharacterized membrane protein SirB2
MISYQLYKVIHLAAIFTFLSGASVMLLTPSKTKFWKILTGVAGFVILVAGMGLMARLYPGQPMQPWIIGKLVIWLVLMGLGHIVAKRFPAYGFRTYWITILLASTAAYLAIYKPF